jgi:hypothetical protein
VKEGKNPAPGRDTSTSKIGDEKLQRPGPIYRETPSDEIRSADAVRVERAYLRADARSCDSPNRDSLVFEHLEDAGVSQSSGAAAPESKYDSSSVREAILGHGSAPLAAKECSEVCGARGRG